MFRPTRAIIAGRFYRRRRQRGVMIVGSTPTRIACESLKGCGMWDWTPKRSEAIVTGVEGGFDWLAGRLITR